ncbi:hypothetical protein LH696_00025 [Enterobacter asburiae]|uniref:hypothetical protein n=1 Tax=Enterobacter asburiae TaxID=61645 RepID=UPI001F28C13B|nr:hypothetical protein [Enterobacter asburiae]MCF1338727.1 hypothetical protein [Enterobacter asburiae]MCQ4337108.1 hypothetical protein [Enterobacter asburiae]HDC4532632.1 hypothetical protein [Enterobacter asburiae]
MQTTIKKTLARQLSPFRCPGCKSRHQILLVQGEYGKKSFLSQRWLKNSQYLVKIATKKSRFWGQIWGQNRAGGMIWGDKMTNIVR